MSNERKPIKDEMKNGKKPFKKTRSHSAPYRGRGREQAPNKEGAPGIAEFNDYKWYIDDPSIANDVSMLNWNVPLGSNALSFGDEMLYDPINERQEVQVSPAGSKLNIPGIVAIQFAMVPGVSDSPNSPVNVAARNLFVGLRKSVSSNLSFGSADIMSYLLACDSLFAYYAFLTRVYGTIPTYSGLNRYIGKALIQASGINYEDVSVNLVKLRTFIDLFRVKVNQFVYAPKDYGFMQRHVFMCQAMYKDSDTVKSQIYVFNPLYFYKWQSFDLGSEGSHLAAIKFGTPNHTGGLTTDELIAYGNSLLEEILSDSDIANIVSLFQRAYGEGGSYQLQPIPDNYTIAPIYSENVLGQIHNASIVHVPNSYWQGYHNAHLSKWDVKQTYSTPTPGGLNDFYIETEPIVWTSSHDRHIMIDNIPLLFTKYMDTYNPKAATLEEIFDNTRAMVTFKALGGPIHLVYDDDHNCTLDPSCTYQIDSAGLDIWTEMTIYEISPDQMSLGSGWVVWSGNNIDATSALVKASWVSSCDWMPRIVFLDAYWKEAEEEGRIYWLGDCFDYCNPAKITDYNIRVLHESCMLGAFRVKVDSSAWK